MAYFFETGRLWTRTYKLRANSCYMVGPAKFSWLTAGPSMEIAQIPSALYNDWNFCHFYAEKAVCLTKVNFLDQGVYYSAWRRVAVVQPAAPTLCDLYLLYGRRAEKGIEQVGLLPGLPVHIGSPATSLLHSNVNDRLTNV